MMVDVRVRKNGVFLQFPISYMVEHFGKMPNMIKLICGGREVEAKLYTVRHDAVLYRVYNRYVSAVLEGNDCVLNTSSVEHMRQREIPVLRIKAHEREECRKRIIVLVKVALTKHLMPKHIVLRIRLKDGSEKIVKASLVSAYNNYAYYSLYAAHARELAPLMDQVQEVRAYEEETQ